MDTFGYEKSLEIQKLEHDIQNVHTLEQLIDVLHQVETIDDPQGLRETNDVIDNIEEIFGDVRLANFEHRDIGSIANLPKLTSVPELHGIRGKVIDPLQHLN
jgi:hypothetical protein